jgi:hypothetical protein
VTEADGAPIGRHRQSGGKCRSKCWQTRAASISDRGMDQLAGSVVENPHGSHLNTFKSSAKARLIVCSNVIGRPQTGQMTSFVNVASPLIMNLWARWQVLAMRQINCAAALQKMAPTGT